MSTAHHAKAPVAPVFKMRKPKRPSSNVSEFDYHLDSKTLRITYGSGSTYDYHGVTPETASAFETAKSLGQLVALSIKGKHPTTLVTAKKK